MTKNGVNIKNYPDQIMEKSSTLAGLLRKYTVNVLEFLLWNERHQARHQAKHQAISI